MRFKLFSLSLHLTLLFYLFSTPLNAEPQRIISLAPHTTEWVYALQKQALLVAVSDYSDYPSEASKLPSVASYQGLDFEQIVRLAPDLIIAWRGGNKPQDLARLEQLGFNIFYSSINTLDDIPLEISRLANILGAAQRAAVIRQQFDQKLIQLRRHYAQQPRLSAFYYMWTKPLMTIGQGAWANQLLDICSVDNIFADIDSDYPQISVEKVARRQPDILIAAMNTSIEQANGFWFNYRGIIKSPVVTVNPDKLHRFTPRLLDELEAMCVAIRSD